MSTKKCSPIIRNVNIDPMEKPKERINIYNTYEIFLYNSIKKGSMPCYKIICNSLDILKSKVDELKEKYDLRTPGSILTRTTTYPQSEYDYPIIIDLNTGELLNES